MIRQWLTICVVHARAARRPHARLNAGGSSAGMTAALESTIARVPADVKVIPGHGAVSTLDDVRRFIEMVKQTRAAVEKGVKAGKKLEQLKQENVLEPWQQYSGPFVSTDLFIETLYNELTGQKSAAAAPVKHN